MGCHHQPKSPQASLLERRELRCRLCLSQDLEGRPPPAHKRRGWQRETAATQQGATRQLTPELTALHKLSIETISSSDQGPSTLPQNHTCTAPVPWPRRPLHPAPMNVG
ncbi:hypothetical protein GOP47_0005822 [Adiantum capillus-veneris]|uniref:Uncharacterized protein n=1 Tax=Adiantum capillus-veneris TaxID=13818 RepID=A0A9D4V6Z9_ADICA|nr:hypothetical protein GOP47_0005822 [Adiantum capillus-veneris]